MTYGYHVSHIQRQELYLRTRCAHRKFGLVTVLVFNQTCDEATPEYRSCMMHLKCQKCSNGGIVKTLKFLPDNLSTNYKCDLLSLPSVVFTQKVFLFTYVIFFSCCIWNITLKDGTRSDHYIIKIESMPNKIQQSLNLSEYL